MCIEEILRVLPAPALPLQSTGSSWDEIESQIGSVLPDDYKQFVTYYGSGRIDNLLWIFNPFASNKHINFVKQIEVRLEALRFLIEKRSEHPYPLFPNTGGLLPFGGTDNGDTLYWLTEGLANNWHIVINEARGPEYQRFKCGLGVLLPRILRRKDRCYIFPKSFPSNTLVFESKG